MFGPHDSSPPGGMKWVDGLRWQNASQIACKNPCSRREPGSKGLPKVEKANISMTGPRMSCGPRLGLTPQAPPGTSQVKILSLRLISESRPGSCPSLPSPPPWPLLDHVLRVDSTWRGAGYKSMRSWREEGSSRATLPALCL